MNRAILIFPDFEKLPIIEGVREKFDPLFGKVNPHITLVFPFESEISLIDLTEHIKSVATNIYEFDLAATGVSGFNNEYIFLNIREGKELVRQLNKSLYSGLLSEFYNSNQAYNPHITIGRLPTLETYKTALDSIELPGAFDAKIGKISVVSIDAFSNCEVEAEIVL